MTIEPAAGQPSTAPVADWATDYDIFDPGYVADPYGIWADLRSACPIAHDAERRRRDVVAIVGYIQGAIEQRQANPVDDFISELLQAEHDSEPIGIPVVMGMCALLLVAGVDTTWSSIGSTMWDLATHPDDTRRLVDEPELMPTAIEEFLRAYAPVTMARRLSDDVEFAGCPMKAGDRILMNFPAANRDPEVFPDPDIVVLDRVHNRHVAFGAGIHRCAGSNLARMEIRVAVEEWLKHIPEFAVTDSALVTWAGGQVRGTCHWPDLERRGQPDGTCPAAVSPLLLLPGASVPALPTTPQLPSSAAIR